MTEVLICADKDHEKEGLDIDGNEHVFEASQGIPMDNINRFSVATEEVYSDKSEEKINMVDTNGYILYCPCMGRFGNQAEQLIGSLAFAKGLNRTLVLPPWITYPPNSPFGSEQIEFSRWFAIDPLKEYHKVMKMEDFMAELAPKIWPKGKRNGFCFVFRNGNKCAMKEGNPFGPFWDHFGINFDGYFDHPGILWNSYRKQVADEWRERFPPSQHLVLAFQGAPGDFPSKEENQNVQNYLKFSDYIDESSDQYINREMNGEPYIAIHLRNGGDMLSVCEEVKKQSLQTIFCSEQCTGYSHKRKLTHEMCAPSKNAVIKKVKKYLQQTKATRLFIGTDNDPMLKEFKKAFKNIKVSLHRRMTDEDKDSAMIDIAIMAKAEYFIGNCVSSFSAFVRRQREAAGKKVAFFGLD